MRPLALAVALTLASVAATRTAAAAPAPAPSAATDSIRARDLYLHGHYAEARAIYRDRILRVDPVAGAIGMSRCLAAIGDVDMARLNLRSIIASHPPAAAARAELAALEFARGDYATAQAQVDTAL